MTNHTSTIYELTENLTEDYDRLGWDHDARLVAVEQAAAELGYELHHVYSNSPEWPALAETFEAAGDQTAELDQISDRADAIMGLSQRGATMTNHTSTAATATLVEIAEHAYGLFVERVNCDDPSGTHDFDTDRATAKLVALATEATGRSVSVADDHDEINLFQAGRNFSNITAHFQTAIDEMFEDQGYWIERVQWDIEVLIHLPGDRVDGPVFRLADKAEPWTDADTEEEASSIVREIYAEGGLDPDDAMAHGWTAEWVTFDPEFASGID